MLKNMKAHTHLKPGQKGTKHLLEHFGQSLLCVRYRYDEIGKRQLKTVEIIIEEKPYHRPFKLQEGDLVPVRVYFAEIELRDRLKTAGAKWDAMHKVWLVAYGKIRGSELEKRILEDFIKQKKHEWEKLPI